MPTRVSESFILRTYPFREADLIVSFFTREQGKLRGVARRARKPKSPFGAGLERLSHVRMAYFLRENAELASLSSCETMESGFGVQSDYGCSLALDYFTLWAVRLTGFFPEIRVSDEAAALAEEMFTKPLSALSGREWTKSSLSTLRRTLVRSIEQHVERRMLTVPLLEAL